MDSLTESEGAGSEVRLRDKFIAGVAEGRRRPCDSKQRRLAIEQRIQSLVAALIAVVDVVDVVV